MTEYTFGATGTYATLALAVAALPATFDDNYRLLQVGDSAESSMIEFDTYDFTANYYLEITTDTAHKGDPTAGHTITVNT